MVASKTTLCEREPDTVGGGGAAIAIEGERGRYCTGCSVYQEGWVISL
jgi:hypothetical protein